MAVTAFGTGYVLTAQGDALNQATIGAVGNPGNYRLRVNQINLVIGSSTTGGVEIKANTTTIHKVAAAGLTANTSYVITQFGEPQEIDDITATTLPTNATIVVFTR